MVMTFRRCQIYSAVMSYILAIRIRIYNVVGHVPKRDTQKKFRNQNIYRIVAKSERPKLLTENCTNRICDNTTYLVGTSYEKLFRRFNASLKA